jgi:uncharacterized membrane protein
MTRRLAHLLAPAAAVAAIAAPPAAPAQSIDQTCELALVKADPNAINVAFPDESASYWLGTYQAAPGTRIRIHGRYPHARYMSFNVYDPAGRPLDSLNDTQIVPDAGSANPFLPGADRTAARRDYTVTIDFGTPPAQRAPNTLYTGQGQNGLPNAAGSFIYRMYVPDSGRDEWGGAGLPRVALEAGDGGEPVSPADCRGFSKPSADLNRELAQLSPPAAADVLAWPGKDPPVWRRFVNLPVAYADGFLENSYGDPARQAANQLPLSSLGGSGGFLSNRDNDYVYTPISRGHGQVLVLRGKAPTFADTVEGVPTMPSGQQLRYFSICQNEAASTRYVACLRDDQLVLDEDGRYTIVVSTSAQRPAGATAACGVNWLPWGPVEEGVLIYRHMLPDPSFANAIQRIARHGEEEQGLGEYYPRGEYLAGPAELDAELSC